jgi:hypothetical protein
LECFGLIILFWRPLRIFKIPRRYEKILAGNVLNCLESLKKVKIPRRYEKILAGNVLV